MAVRKRIEVVENQSKKNMRTELLHAIRESSQVDFAVAFMDLSGLNLLLDTIVNFLRGSGHRLRILTRVSKEAFNEPAVLRRLIALSKRFDKRMEFRISALEDFHEKLYICSKEKLTTVLVGSSNLTKKALIGKGEVNVKLTATKKDRVISQLTSIFEKHWNQGSRPAKGLMEDYADYCNRSGFAKQGKEQKDLWAKVRTHLGRGKVRHFSVPLQEVTGWLTAVEGELSAANSSKICRESDWEESLFFFDCTRRFYDLTRRNDIVIMANYNTQTLNAFYIEDFTRIKTNEGTYFCAVRRIPRSRNRKIGKALTDEVKEYRVIPMKSDLQDIVLQRLTRRKLEFFGELLSFNR